MAKWQDRAIAATHNGQSQLGAILLCAMDRNRGQTPCFVGKAQITSDGCVMCDFVGTNGGLHMGAFVGSAADLRANIIGLAKHLRLSAPARKAFYSVMADWIATDYSGHGLGLPDGKEQPR